MVIHAYASLRGKNRSGTDISGTVRHAVDEISHLCGAHDTICGRPITVHVGAWIDDEPGNCRACTRILANEGAVA